MKERRRRKHIKLTIVYVALISTLLVSSTFSKFQTEVNKSGSIKTANWKFDVKINNIQYEDGFILDLADTVTNSNTNVTSGVVAPGSEGQIKLEIDCTSCQTGVDYSYILKDANANLPSNLKFYTTNSYDSSSEVNLDTTNTHTLPLADVKTIQTYYIYWKWLAIDDTTSNQNDISSNGNNFEISIKITGEQHIKS